jgi:hypothetical protein
VLKVFGVGCGCTTIASARRLDSAKCAGAKRFTSL